MEVLIIGMLAALCGVAGIGCLFFSWRGTGSGKRLRLVIGWGCLALSPLLWSASAGWEFGLVLGLLAPALSAWIVALAAAKTRLTGDDWRPRLRLRRVPLSRVLSNSGRFLLLVPGAALSATLVCVALVYWVPLQSTDRVAVAVLLMPAVWGSMICWLLIDRLQWRPLVTGLLFTLFSALYIF